MEQKLVAKRAWNIVRVLYYMLRKGLTKPKTMMLDLTMMMKRGKIAGKALHNLMFHQSRPQAGPLAFPIDSRHYEFSCSNTPSYPFMFGKRKNPHSHFFPCIDAPATDDDLVTVNAVKMALEMLNNDAAGMDPRFLQSPAVRDMVFSAMSSPALPGFERTPMARQLRITDSPFPLKDVDENIHVDDAAEEFISRFYNELKKQSKIK